MQRKLVAFISIFFLFTLAAHSQYKKGMRMVGASIGSAIYNSGKSDYSFPPPTTGYTNNDNNFSISINPSMGWFISEHTVIGALLNLYYNHDKTFDESGGTTFDRNTSNTFNIGIGGFARNYFNSSGSVLPFGQFNLNFGTGSSSKNGFYYIGSDKYTYDGKSSGNFYINSGLAFGITKMLNAHTGLDFFGGYTYSYNKNTFKTTTQVTGSTNQTNISEPTQKFTNHGFSIGAGFQIFLEGRKK